MKISDEELREMVRDAIAHRASQDRVGVMPVLSAHASHGVFAVLRSGDVDGRCVIEPAVPCTHCGYCQSFGH